EHGRRAVARERQCMNLSEAGDAQEPADPAAAGDIGLQAIDPSEQIAEVGRNVRVLAGRHLERRALADEPQAVELARAHRLLEPGHAPLAGVPVAQARASFGSNAPFAST